MSSAEHEHCATCFDRQCSSHAEYCAVKDCGNQCGARFHACKEDEHLSLCPRAVVACVNSQHGCPFSFDRRKQGPHLLHCPANIIFCSHVWFRRNRKEREQDEISSDPPLPTNHIEFALAYRDQEQVGGVECLEDCSVSARPKQRVCRGLDVVPRSESVETLQEACSAQGAPTVPDLVHMGASDSSASSWAMLDRDVDEEKVKEGGAPPSRMSDSGVFEDDPNAGLTYPSSDEGGEGNTMAGSLPEKESQSRLSSSGIAIDKSASSGEAELERPPTPPASSSLPSNFLSVDSPQSSVRVKGGPKGSGFAKMLGRKQNNNLVKTEAGSVSDLSMMSTDSEAFHAGMGTKLRSHVQNSRRKIARVLTGKILHRSPSSTAANGETAMRSYKHKLASHSPTDRQEDLDGLEVVTHKDSFVVPANSSTGITPLSRRSRPSESSLRSESSLHAMLHRPRNGWRLEEERVTGSKLFKTKRDLDDTQLSAESKLLFELPLYFYPRHLYPDDGLVQCQCSQSFRRDEIAAHQQFVHADIDSLLSANHLASRCPLAMYGCRHVTGRLFMPQAGWKLTVVKGALAVQPGTHVLSGDFRGKRPSPSRHLTTMPVDVLKRVCSFLDPLALSCLAQTCSHLRQVVSTVLPKRGMVEAVWERVESHDDGDNDDEDGYVTWKLARHRWTLSQFVDGVSLDQWRLGGMATVHHHGQHCKVARGDRLALGDQWQPLTGLVDAKEIEMVSDSDFEDDSDEEESEGEAPAIAEGSGMTPTVRMKSVPNSTKLSSATVRRGQVSQVGSQVRRRGRAGSKQLDGDPLQREMFAIIDDEEIDDIQEDSLEPEE